MLVDHLGDRVAQKHDVLVKGFDLALKLDAVDEINGNGDAILAKDVQERILKKLTFLSLFVVLRPSGPVPCGSPSVFVVIRCGWI